MYKILSEKSLTKDLFVKEIALLSIEYILTYLLTFL